MKFDTRTATNVGLLIALSIILTRFFGMIVPIAGVMALRISFGEIPIILGGILFGPMAGAFTGIAADLIGFMLNSHGGAFFPGFTLSAALTGLIPGLFLYKHSKTYNIYQLALVVFITDLFTGAFLNTLWLTMMMNRGFFILLPPRLVTRLFTVPIYTAAIYFTRKAYMAYRGTVASVER